MNKLLLSLSILTSFSINILTGQDIIPNGGFENWEERFLFSKPSDWLTHDNPEYTGQTTEKSDESVDGDYSLLLTSILREREGREDEVVFGFAVLGRSGEDEMPRPAPWPNATVDRLHFSLKYETEPGDASLFWIQLTMDDDVVFEHIDFIQGSQDTWLPVEIILDGGAPVEADGLLIGFTSSVPEGFPGGDAFEPKAGSRIMIDNIRFTLGEGPDMETIPVPNGSFEEWEDITAYEPEGWTSTNTYMAAMGVANVTPDEPGFLGNYSARLETVSFEGEIEKGILSLGEGLWERGGIEFTGRPAFISGAYKLIAGQPAQYNNIGLRFRKEGFEEDIGGTWLRLPPSDEYRRFMSWHIWYTQPEINPDIMRLEIYSGDEEGDILFIDDLAFPEPREITFRLRDQGNNPADGEITIEGIDPLIIGDVHPFYTDNGDCLIYLPDGIFKYSVNVPGFEEISGEEFTVSGESKTIDVELTSAFAGGDGSWDSPWEIATAGQLDNVRKYSSGHFGYKHFILTDDINLGESAWNDGEGWEPVGDSENPFVGNFNGDGFTITGLTINRPDAGYAGLFGKAEWSEFSGITLEDVNITGKSRIGGLIGYADNNVTITNCSVTGVIEGEMLLGGIAGGLDNSSAVSYSYSGADIVISPGQQNSLAGGMAGRITSNSRIEYSYSTGNVTGPGNMVGGLVGMAGNFSLITNSYATGDIEGNFNVGGLAGMIESGIYIAYCYSTGRVTGNGGLGGLAGGGQGISWVECYWNSETSHQWVSAAGDGLTIVQMTDQSSFDGWDFDHTWGFEAGVYPYLLWQTGAGQHNYPPEYPSPVKLEGSAGDGVVELSWEKASAGDPTGYRIYRDNIEIETLGNDQFGYTDDEVVNLTDYVYYITALSGPEESGPSNKVTATPNPGFQEGSGTSEDPFKIHNADELNMMRYYLDSHFELAGNIDLGTEPWNLDNGWAPVGSFGERFTGSLYGNGFIVSNLYINRLGENNTGLFGFIDGATIDNMYLDNINVTGGLNVGGLAGVVNGSTIVSSGTSGVIDATGGFAGGLVGVINNSGAVHFSFSSADVSSAEGNQVGGLAGTNMNMSIITNSYASGRVTGNKFIGGLAGAVINSTIENSYSSGNVSGNGDCGGLAGGSHESLFTGAYWVAENSGQAGSAGGESRTIAEMMQVSTFEGWDFEDAWSVQQGISFPWLDWQDGPLPVNMPPSEPAPWFMSAVQDEEIAVISWNEPSTGSPDGYNIYRDGLLAGYVNSPQTGYSDTDVDLFNTYLYYVKAVYDAVESTASNPMTLEMLPWFSGGEGTEGSPYQVSTPGDLYNIRYHHGTHFIQTADIDLGEAPWNEGEGWDPAGTQEEPFSGNYNGAGFTISNLTINRPGDQYTGLFGYLVNSAVYDLTITGADISGGGFCGILSGNAASTLINNVHSDGSLNVSWNSGGLVGGAYNNSEISNSSFTGSINGKDNIGALVGFNQSSIHQSFSGGTVSGNSWVGGLAGYNTGNISESYSNVSVQSSGKGSGGLAGWNDVSGSIINSYSTGDVEGNESVGGFTGLNTSSGNISSSYSTGYVSGNNQTGGFTGEQKIVGSSQDSYWNTETSGQTTSAGEESGLNTAQMIQQVSFDGWDFNAVWDIVENTTYPYLQWQTEPGPQNYPPGLSVDSTDPGDGDDEVPVEVVISVWFDKDIQQGALGTESITLFDGQDDVMVTTDIDGKLLTVTPESNLEFSTQYTLTIPPGSVADALNSDNTLVSGFILIFTTVFDPDEEFTVTIYPDPVDGGTVSGEGLESENGYYSGNYTAGQDLEFTAMPEDGYGFLYWLVNEGEEWEIIYEDESEETPVGNVLSGPMPPFNIELTARFGKYYDLIVNIVPAGSGTVSAPGMDGGEGRYMEGEQFSITAVPNPGFEFDYWSYFDNETEIVIGGDNPAGNVLEITMPGGDVELFANFRESETGEITATFLDDDIDKVYFAGDDFSVQITLAGETIPDGVITPVVTEGIYDQEMTFNEENILVEDASRVVTAITGNEFTVSGKIRPDVSQGVIGFKLNIGGQEIPPFPVIDNNLFDPASGSDFGMAIAGVEIPFGDISASPGLVDFGNLYDTEGPVTFIRDGHGSLVFGGGLNIIDKRDELTALHSGLRLVSSAPVNVYYVEIDPASLTFLAGREADITIEGYEQAGFTVRKTGFGITAGYDAPEDAKANATAELAGNILTFTVDGFSRYTVLDELYVLTLEAEPAAGGIVTDVTGNGAYPEGEVLTVKADANDGYVFLNWAIGDNIVSTDAEFIYTMPGNNVTLTASFEVEVFTVNFTVLKESETPVEGAVITIKEGQATVATLVTGAEGKASEEMPAGQYSYSVIADDYEDGSGTFTVSDHDIDITVTLLHVGLESIGTPEVNVSVYPNPSNGLFNVEYSGNRLTTISIEIMSVTGNTVYIREFQDVYLLRETIDLQHISKGMYFLRINESGNVNTLKMIFR